MNEMNEGLRKFLLSIRKTEGMNYGSVGQAEEGVRPFGAYGMLVENWDAWAAQAGVAGHDKFDPAAQDYVASFWAQKLFQRYGDWDMVAMAWFAGGEQTDRAAQSGEGVDWFKHTKTQDFFARYKSEEEATAAQQPNTASYETLPSMAGSGAQWVNMGATPAGWLMPVAGQNKYSNSFRVPRNNKSGIHGAIDVYAKRGTPIVTPVGGTVLSTKRGDIGGYTVRIRGNDGLTYYYAHMDAQAVVKPGQTVQAGTHLGFVGDSGNAKGTTPHLHFSIRKGNALVNPYSYLEGSKNAGNYYSPENVPKEDPTQESISKKYNGMLNAVSNRVAGGERVDYRTLGQPDKDESEGSMFGSDREITSDEGPY